MGGQREARANFLIMENMSTMSTIPTNEHLYTGGGHGGHGGLI